MGTRLRRAIAGIRAIATTEGRLRASETGVEDAARGEVTSRAAAARWPDTRLGEREPAHHVISAISRQRARDRLVRRGHVQRVRAREALARGQCRRELAGLAEEARPVVERGGLGRLFGQGGLTADR